MGEGINARAALLLFVASVGATQLTAIPRSDGSLKVILPPGFSTNINHQSCDAHWEVNNKTVAIITKDGITSQPPVKSATLTSVTIDSCTGSVRYFIDCLETRFREDIVYSCATDTSTPTPRPPVTMKDTTGSSLFRERTTVRNRNALIISISLFGTVCLSISIPLLASSKRRNQRKAEEEGSGL